MNPAEDNLSATFGALSSAIRRSILARLAQGEATVLELAEPFELSLPAISKHLKVLERAGLVERGKRAQYRPCNLSIEPLADAQDWVLEVRALWDARFAQMDSYLRDLQKPSN